MDNIVQRGLLHDFIRGFDTLDIFSNNLILAPKVPRYSYSILSDNITIITPPQKKKSLVNSGKTFWMTL